MSNRRKLKAPRPRLKSECPRCHSRNSKLYTLAGVKTWICDVASCRYMWNPDA